MYDGGTVTNAGTITGVGYSVQFGAGNPDRVIVDPGAVFVGTVNGGNPIGATSISTLELTSAGSSGTLAGLGSQYINFARTTLDLNASWTLSSANTVAAGATLTNSGTLFDSGTLTNAGLLTGAGRFVIGPGDSLIDTGTVASTATIAFGAATGVLDITPLGFSAVIGTFQLGDAISLTGVSNITSFSVINSNTLDLVRADSSHIDLTLDRNAITNDFTTAVAGSNTVLTTDVILCFAGGTRIDTPSGPVAVEALRVGDNVLTVSGQARAIQWIGRRHLDLTRHPRPETVSPVRIAPGAFGPNIPGRALFLSPNHAVLVDGVLVPIRLLVNGATIASVRRRNITYYHVELAVHEVILAEGMAVESYLDTGDRAEFETETGVTRLHPDFAARFGADAAMTWETRGAAPLVLAGERLRRVRKIMAANTAFAPSPANESDLTRRLIAFQGRASA